MEVNPIIGHMISREVVRITDQGAFVDGGSYGDLFVPRRQLPDNLQEGDNLRVFLYFDGGRLLATARHPYLELGMTGRLTITSIDCGTAYLDLGIPKELVVPISEQRTNFEVGNTALIYVAQDEMGRLFGTQRLNRYIEDVPDRNLYKVGQRVVAVPVERTPLGYRVVVDDRYYGLIYASEQKGEIRSGKRYDAYIVNVREDGRLDVSLQEPGRSGIEHAAFEILKILDNSNGKLPFSDKSDPKDIEAYLHMSKGKFKKAIGFLYKARFILIEDNGILLTDKGYEEISLRKERKF